MAQGSVVKTFSNFGKSISAFVKNTKKFLKSSKYRTAAYYSYCYNHTKTDKKIILYEAFFGRGMLCGPYAIFLEALKEPRMENFEHFWVIAGSDDLKKLKKENNNPHVHFVQYNSRKYLKLLSKAGYLINNVNFKYYFTKKPDQIYVNTWHGIPLKTLGYDMPNGKTETSNVVRNMMLSDYMISASPFLTQIYLKSYKLDEIYTGKIIEEGYPRLDLIDNESYDERAEVLFGHGVKIQKGKKVILYAPTWKGKSYGTASSDVSGLFEFKSNLEKMIDTDKYQILIKPHQRLWELAHNDLNFPFVVPATVDANLVLGITDILVSDFSSIFYDFLRTGRPVLFLIEDYESYASERGLYFSPTSALPGPVAVTASEIASYINDIESVTKAFADKYREISEFACASASPCISKRIIDIVFFKKTEGYNIISANHTKKKILLSRGRMGINGITTSMLSLLNNIDYDRYDVTLMIEKTKDDRRSGFIERINKHVRVIYRTQMPPMTAAEVLFYKYERKRDSHTEIRSKGLKREWSRLFGDVVFDSAIDFSGYIYFDAALLLVGSARHKSIWLHNDMKAEYDNKNRIYRYIFAIYSLFDSVVACGKEIMRVNAEKIPGHYGLKSRITYAGNTIDLERILSESMAEPRYDIIHEDPESHKRVINFITIGRMSPEKNQPELVRGFKLFHDKNPDSKLYIFGTGKLKKELRAYVEENNLMDSVIMPGTVKNPYPMLKNADCFILPSIYEGLPMTVYEARVLHKPIIMSDFDSVTECETENGQLVVGKSANEIYKGMVCYKEGRVPENYIFDAEAYNKEKMDEFYHSVGV